ncbi:hypothetical protein U9M48_018272 [Paspalum notatum var. saurae]|uniref:Uncharacterized protein n=1 Tax=Paspalum notatum var. saurae TaxID=547442 RepID=A0AAQ3T9P5_PASNO
MDFHIAAIAWQPLRFSFGRTKKRMVASMNEAASIGSRQLELEMAEAWAHLAPSPQAQHQGVQGLLHTYTETVGVLARRTRKQSTLLALFRRIG